MANNRESNPPADGIAGSSDPVALFERMTEVFGRTQQMLAEFWLGHDGETEAAESGGTALVDQWAKSWSDWSEALQATNPERMAAMVGDYWRDQAQLWGAVLGGREDEIPAAARTLDRRFQGEAWGAAPVYDLLRRSYLLASHYVAESLGAVEGISDGERRKLEFQARQFVDAMSPANFASLNPEVLAEAQATNGESLLKGVQHLLADLGRGQLTMTDESAFAIGRNVATTPGKVIYEGPLFQLIQYAPSTPDVFETPILILPPWINKYYILDLTPEKSFVRWAVGQGFTVFVVSWAQGSAELRDVGLGDYAIDGELKAIDLVRQACGVPSVHVVGYCVAGSVLAATLAWMAREQQADKVKTATFLTAQVDFTEAGDLLSFTTAPMLNTVNQLIADKGYLDGRFLSTTFNFLRPTDLLWNYVVNNYLKGKGYTAFDLLYWNSDPTNVPGKFMQQYLPWFYRDNLLAKPGGITIRDVAIDLKAVHTPVYIQAGRDDHIAPASSCFKLTRAFSGEHRFMLAGSGHIAGVVNPPAQKKYQFWTLPEGVETPATLEEFRDKAVETRGSWWPDWVAWLQPRSGARIKAREPGKGKGFPALEDAPGSYVRKRIA